MSTRFVRPARGFYGVLVVSAFYHRHNRDDGRQCPKCNAKWTIEFDSEGTPHVWRNGSEEQTAVLDWSGNNAAVECCTEGEAATSKSRA